MAPSSPSPKTSDPSPPAAPVKPEPKPIRPERSYPWPRVWAAVAINWVAPGAGYFLVGETLRAALLVILLNGMFLLGLGLKGAVIVPEFNIRSQTFNVINVLTFGVELGAGGPAVLSLGARDRQARGSDSAGVRFFAGKESAATHDLAAFHLLLVGALNYFACCALYDRFRPRPQPDEKARKER